ncbi:hypothetical protein ETC01_15415 [Geobacillus sp. NFOSA3]|nr:hypothetical protein [Geobacillus sp. NFOSA3]
MERIQVTNKERLHQLRYTGVTEERLQYVYEYRNILLTLVDPIVNELYEEESVKTLWELFWFAENRCKS